MIEGTVDEFLLAFLKSSIAWSSFINFRMIVELSESMAHWTAELEGTAAVLVRFYKGNLIPSNAGFGLDIE